MAASMAPMSQKAHDDLRFGPSFQPEMVVKGRHEKDAAAFAELAAAVFEITYLHHHRNGLNDEDSPDQEKDEFLADDDRDVSDQPAQRPATRYHP